MQVIALSLALIGGAVAQAAVATVWIKDTAHDTSTWPVGFPQIPQPASESDVDRINGSGASSLDTDFDALMRRKANRDTTVYLGPGLFMTRGSIGNTQPQSYSPGFRLQDHSRLIGSGKGGSTTNGTT